MFTIFLTYKISSSSSSVPVKLKAYRANSTFFHFLLSFAASPQQSMSVLSADASFLTLFNQFARFLPLFAFPFGIQLSYFSVILLSSILIMCPNHWILLFLINLAIGTCLLLSYISALGIRSLHLTPRILLRHLAPNAFSLKINKALIF